jgi:uncharacterized protein (TIGR02145 family)
LCKTINPIIIKNLTLITAAAALLSFGLQAQVCDPAVAPTDLVSTYTPGSGVLLEWDAIPGSVGVQLRVDLPSGPTISRRIVGPEVDQFFAPDALLSPGTYTWRVQAACNTVLPFDLTPISTSNTFAVGGGSSCVATVTDIEGNVYTTIQIGSQCWMAENLKVERYNNGDDIPTGLSNSAWSSTNSGAFAVYGDLAANKATYGLLYNWHAVVDDRRICPVDWHLPDRDDWIELQTYLGGVAIAGAAMKQTGVLEEGTGLWLEPNTMASNTSGFSGEPGGRRNADADYVGLHANGIWWSNTEKDETSAFRWRLYYLSGGLLPHAAEKSNGFSVRCIYVD